MSRLALASLFVFALACKGEAPEPSDNPDPDPQPGDRVERLVTAAEGDIGVVVAGHNAFTWDLYGVVTAEEDDNVFFSPFSMTAAFGMTLAGSAGLTADQLSDVLHVGLDEADWHVALGDLTRDLSGDYGRGYTLHIANRLFGQDGFPWEPDFLAVCEEAYDAALEPWDFTSDPEGGRQLVNDWVEAQTADRIQNLLPSGSVDENTRLVLANAIYFLADWATAFDPDLTSDAPFHRLDGSTVQVPMMTLDTEDVEDHGIRVGWTADAAIVQLPYQDHEVSMVLVIPHQVDGLPALEAGLDAATFDGWLDTLGGEDVFLAMPRLEIEWEVELSEAFRDLGAGSLFDSGSADLTGMADTPDGNLYVTGAFHKAFIKVDEAGTEAAAATGVVVGLDSAPMPVEADRPFLFVIRDDLTGAILFAGRVMDPS